MKQYRNHESKIMTFIFDADLLSTFAKIERLEFLPKIFGERNLLFPPSIKADLNRSKDLMVKDISNSGILKETKLDKQELNLSLRIHERANLGIGESECISICKFRNAVFVTNDKKAIQFAENLDIETIDLETILFALREIIGKQQLIELIQDIETKDKVIVVRKKEILEENKGKNV